MQWNTTNPLKKKKKTREQALRVLMIKKAFQDTLLRKRGKVQNNVYSIPSICIKQIG